ncbi:hypothetical protein DSLASN_27420 [Desulfoluna limicola]|uniref:Solute-binding protein family 3/N-terminal domain-containing protein n=1 Tax=Desulfoluna limicola TaxID=2810562 RepID=A0ABM7PHP8_9BACT|nr:hypothetical protein [Desulfoluna limicola]BCS97110.1 hypothetical protein DSLASN_27420 [Desulfoluna limicola]
MKHLVFISWVFTLFFAQPLSAKSLTLSVDERDWVPFTFQKAGISTGMHIELVTHALQKLGYGVKIIPYPRKRAIHNAKSGIVDGMVSIAFHPALSSTLIFPKDAAFEKESAWRIMQVDHVLITPKTGFEYSGDLKTLPLPVRIPSGETISLNLKNAGLKVDEARSDLINVKKMNRDGDGSVVATSIMAERLNEDPEFADKIKIHATPISSQSYYLAFSRVSPLSYEEKQQIWDEIQKWRNDYVFMLQVYATY